MDEIIPAVHDLLGHKDIGTMIYTHEASG